MKQETLRTANRASLEEVKGQFEHWRKARKKRATIPKPLWKAAIELSRDYTVNTISRALGLSNTDLRKHIKAAQRSIGDNQEVIPKFVEFDLGSGISREYFVEMENPNGARMKIEFKGGIGRDIIELARAFWGN